MPDMPFSVPLVALRPSNVKIIATAAPAAGAESITIVPAGKAWRLLTFLATLTTDGTVATRIPYLIIDDGTTVLFRAVQAAAAGATASQAIDFYAATIGVSMNALTGVQTIGAPLPDPTFLVLQPGWRIRTTTIAIVAGDQWGIAKMIVDEISNIPNPLV